MPHPALPPRQQFVADMATKGLTERHLLCYESAVLLIRGRIRMRSAVWSETRRLRAVSQTAPGRLWASFSSALTTEAGGAFPRLGQERTGNAPLDQVPGSMACS